MALSPSFSYSVDAVIGEVTVTNTTTFGDGISDPSRSQALVNFVATWKPTAGDIDLPLVYDEETVTSSDFVTVGDGVIEIVMTITPAPSWGGAAFSYTQKVVLLFTAAFDACYLSKLLDFMRERCDCGCKEADLILDLDLACTGMDIAMTRAADFDRAQCVLEEAAALCAADCNC